MEDFKEEKPEDIKDNPEDISEKYHQIEETLSRQYSYRKSCNFLTKNVLNKETYNLTPPKRSKIPKFHSSIHKKSKTINESIKITWTITELNFSFLITFDYISFLFDQNDGM